MGPETALAAGTTTCLAPGTHYFVNRWLETAAGSGGSIYGAANGTTILSINRNIKMNGPGVLANLTIKQTGFGQDTVVTVKPTTGNNVLVSNVIIEDASSSALSCDGGTTTIANSYLSSAGGYAALYATNGAVILQNTTLTGARTGISLWKYGTATMDAASKIIGNDGHSGSAVAIYKRDEGGGSFTNNGGTISGNVSRDDDCDNDVNICVFFDCTCCTEAGNGKTGTCARL